MHIFSPLRYPGGKGKLASFIKEVFYYNNLCDGEYIEPYAGGSAVALSLLLEGYARKIVINDIDRAVFAFWWTVLNNTEFLSRRINDTAVNMETWHKQRTIYHNKDQHPLEDVGFATFFLNRTNRSGIIKGGVIGGLNQDGPYKLNARYNKKELMKRIKLIAGYSGRISLYNLDAYDLITELSPNITSKVLVYFDPPYFKKGRSLYKNFYTPADHEKMASIIRRLKYSWIVTYDNTPEIKKLYEGSNQVEFDISYSAHLTRPRGTEVMFYHNIELPVLPYTRKEQSSTRARNT